MNLPLKMLATSVLLLSSVAHADMDEAGVLVNTQFCLGDSAVMVDQDSIAAFGPTFYNNLQGFVLKRSVELGLLTPSLTQPNSCLPVIKAFMSSPGKPRPAVLLVVLEATPAAEDGSTRALMMATNVLTQDPYSKSLGVLWQKTSIAVAGDAMDDTVTEGFVQERISRQLQQLKAAWVKDQKK